MLGHLLSDDLRQAHTGCRLKERHPSGWHLAELASAPQRSAALDVGAAARPQQRRMQNAVLLATYTACCTEREGLSDVPV